MLEIGLTGGIGSGKSLIARIFKMFDVPVFDADFEAKSLYQEIETMEKIRQLFGERVFNKGEIDRKVLANMVFSEQSMLNKLNQLIHPKVRSLYTNWVGKNLNAPYVVYEAAILFETGYYQKLDKTILVVAEEELRIRRTMKRDQTTRAEVLHRMSRQWSDERKIPLADFIIHNNDNDLLLPQVYDVHQRLLGF
ncbi:MAG TPA: dephospho-CoA kinase [Bacteroidales bacterium]|nr:dephospho-CoA kinase [Bacteroidales bacterium]HPR58328.1 dephospho-CoA kinase [Bacteroidales bacterium]HRW97014.1 dephospho-CoA kinase [Bacteroidales bacterium]